MKITQITSTDAVNEAPGGSALGNIARKVGAKVAGAVGAKGTAAGMTGKVDANKRVRYVQCILHSRTVLRTNCVVR